MFYVSTPVTICHRIWDLITEEFIGGRPEGTNFTKSDETMIETFLALRKYAKLKWDFYDKELSHSDDMSNLSQRKVRVYIRM